MGDKEKKFTIRYNKKNMDLKVTEHPGEWKPELKDSGDR